MEDIKPISILLAEDNATDVRLILETLKDSKLKVNIHHVKDGAEVIDFLNKHDRYMDSVTPDLLLLDLSMPKKNGVQVLKEIKENPNLAKLPVVILTISKLDQDILDAYNLNASLYVTKPIDLTKFLEIIKSIDNFWLTVIRDTSKTK
jgi:chemotaxis family two-component system response regulator Rcp1